MKLLVLDHNCTYLLNAMTSILDPQNSQDPENFCTVSS